jgi:hypothetical protein
MTTRFLRFLTLTAALGLVFATSAGAQPFETIGIRAQGMGGAFVAVADDATATWWNPAGLASGGLFDAVVQRGSLTDPDDPGLAGPASRTDQTAVSMAYPALALSYYRLRVNDIRPQAPTQTDELDREEDGLDPVELRSFALSQYSVTTGQSISSAFVVATTLKLVRAGRLETLSTGGSDDPMEQARDLDPDVETELGLDVGVMLRLGYLRVGGTLRNLRQPKFGEGDEEFVLEREARVGAAVLTPRVGPFDGFTFSVDTDLRTLDTIHGERRALAGGAEAWLFGRRVGLRGGVSGSTVGDSAQSASAGMSLAAQRGVYVDGFVNFGSDEARGGWGVGLRVTF